MITVDTNVLLRYLLGDDLEQAAEARKLIQGHECVLVTDVVLTETIWTLRGERYKASKDDILKMAGLLFQEPTIRFEDGATIWKAFQDYRLAETVRDYQVSGYWCPAHKIPARLSACIRQTSSR